MRTPVRRMDMLLVLLAIALVRLLPHPWNLTPIGATALFAGAYLPLRWAWAVPLVPLAIGDLAVGGYHLAVMLAVYGGFASTAWLGYFCLRRKVTVPRLGGAVLCASGAFFVISNFGVWLAGMYDYSWAGLVACYTMAIPYFGNTLAGDALYSLLFFGGSWLVSAISRLAMHGVRPAVGISVA